MTSVLLPGYKGGIRRLGHTHRLVVGSRKGQVHRERATFTRFTRDVNMARMLFHDPVRDGEAQARATLSPRPSFVGSIEAIEDMRKVSRWDTNTRIGDREHRLISFSS